jgi:hypothetical protein
MTSRKTWSGNLKYFFRILKLIAIGEKRSPSRKGPTET